MPMLLLIVIAPLSSQPNGKNDETDTYSSIPIHFPAAKSGFVPVHRTTPSPAATLTPMLLLIVIAPLSSQPNGKNDGSVQGKAYFKCKPKFGVFVRPSQVKLLNSEGNPVEDISSRSGGRLVSGEYIVVCRSPRVRARLTFPWTSLVRDLLCPRMQETSAIGEAIRGRCGFRRLIGRPLWLCVYFRGHRYL
jgi:hypothetical protein